MMLRLRRCRTEYLEYFPCAVPNQELPEVVLYLLAKTQARATPF